MRSSFDQVPEEVQNDFGQILRMHDEANLHKPVLPKPGWLGRLARFGESHLDRPTGKDIAIGVTAVFAAGTAAGVAYRHTHH